MKQRINRLAGALLIILSGLALFSPMIAAASGDNVPSAPQLSATPGQIQASGSGGWKWVSSQEVDGTINGTKIIFWDSFGISHYWEARTTSGANTTTYQYPSGITCNNKSVLMANPAFPNSGSIGANVWADQPGVGTNCRGFSINVGAFADSTNISGRINIGDSVNADIIYKLSGNNIVKVDNDSSYTFIPAGVKNVFVRKDQNGGSCPDEIVISPSVGDKMGNAILYGMQPNGGGAKPPATTNAASNCTISPSKTDADARNGSADFGATSTAIGLSPTVLKNSNGSLNLHVGGVNASTNIDPNGQPIGGPTPPGGSTTQNSCNDTSSFAWVICPAITMIDSLTTYVFDNVLSPILQVSPLNDPANSALRTVWGSFRSLADVFFVVIFLIMIFGTAISTGIDSYTIKKVLPRLVIAAILVQFSFFICGIIIDISNVLGVGIIGLVNSVLHITASSTATGGAANSALSGFVVYGSVLGVSAIMVWLAAPVVLFFLIGLLISIITFFVTLMLRLLLINVLVVLSPVAFVLWVLPNTEKLFKKWLDNFVKVALMFPMMAMLLAAGELVRAVSVAGSNQISTLIGLIAPIIAFCMMPMTFKWAGTAMSGVGKVVGGRGAALNAKAQNSQLAKDMKATNKGKQALKYQDAKGLRKVMRGAAVGGVGGMLGTDGAKRRIATLASKHENDQGDQYEEQMRRSNGGLGFSKEDYEALINGRDGDTIKGVKVSDASRKRAIQMAAKSGNYASLRKIKNAYPADKWEGSKMEAAYKQGLAGTDAFTKAPDLLRTPGTDGLRALSADQFAGMHSSTKQAAVKQMHRDLTSTALDEDGKADRTKGQETLNAMLQAIDKSPGAIDVSTQRAIWDYVNDPSTTSATIDPSTGLSIGSALTPEEAAAVRDRFDNAGNLKQGQAVRTI